MRIEHVIRHAIELDADEVRHEVAAPQDDLREKDAHGGHAGAEPVLEPHRDEREDQREIAEVEEIGRAIFRPINRHEHGHEGGEGEFQRHWQARFVAG